MKQIIIIEVVFNNKNILRETTAHYHTYEVADLGYMDLEIDKHVKDLYDSLHLVEADIEKVNIIDAESNVLLHTKVFSK